MTVRETAASATNDDPAFQIYQPPRRVMVLGCPVAALTLEETVAEVHKIIATRRPHQHCVVNAGKIVLMNRNPELRRIVNGCSLINADGQSIVWAASAVGKPIPERVTGIDLMERLFAEADHRRYRLFLLGARPEIVDRVAKIIRERYPNAVIAGARDGYFSEADKDDVVGEVAASNADILFVAMGSPKKEYWLSENLESLNVPFCMGVGGSFDVVAGSARRAPRWIQRAGMEWFYRFVQEPRRLWRRYLLHNMVFIYLLALDVFRIRFSLAAISSQDLSDKEIT